MTVKELINKTCSQVYVVDSNNKCYITPWNIFYEAFKDCIIDNIEAGNEGELLLTLKTQLIKKEG